MKIRYTTVDNKKLESIIKGTEFMGLHLFIAVVVGEW